jgi:hypothetical protein
METPKFREFISEAKEESYRLVILSHDDAEDPNKTGDLIRDKAKKLGIECILGEFVGAYTSIKEDELYINTFPVAKGGAVAQPDPKTEIKYDKPFKLNPENTIIMSRGLGTPGVSGNKSWYDMIKDFEHRGFTVINTNKCHDICSDKVMNQIIFERHDFNTPKTVRIYHSEGSEKALEELDSNGRIIRMLYKCKATLNNNESITFNINNDLLELISTEDWSQIKIEDGTIGYVYSRFITEM